MICLLGLNRRNIATTFKYLLKNERWQCSLLICKDRIRIKLRMSLGSAMDYLCRIICHYGMICPFWESVSPLMTPQPLMSPHPYQYRAGSALHQAKRARHRALGIERTAGVGSSGPRAWLRADRALYREYGQRTPRERHRVDRAQTTCAASYGPRAMSSARPAASSVRRAVIERAASGPRAVSSGPRQPANPSRLPPRHWRPHDAAGRARGQLNAAPAVRQMPRAAQSMPTARRPKARLPTARSWRPTIFPRRPAAAAQQPANPRPAPQAYYRRLPRRHSERRHLRQLMILSQE